MENLISLHSSIRPSRNSPDITPYRFVFLRCLRTLLIEPFLETYSTKPTALLAPLFAAALIGLRVEVGTLFNSYLPLMTGESSDTVTQRRYQRLTG
jgi:hypothetical protein